MSMCKNILVPVSLTEQGSVVIAKAELVAKCFGATLSAINVVRPMPVAWITHAEKDNLEDEAERIFGGEIQPIEDEKEIYQSFQALCVQHNILPENQHFCMGKLEDEIIKLARSIKADLLIVGRHKHSGLDIFSKHTVDKLYEKLDVDIFVVNA